MKRTFINKVIFKSHTTQLMHLYEQNKRMHVKKKSEQTVYFPLSTRGDEESAQIFTQVLVNLFTVSYRDAEQSLKRSV